MVKSRIDLRKVESSATEIAEEKIPTNIMYDDNPRNDIVISPNGG